MRLQPQTCHREAEASCQSFRGMCLFFTLTDSACSSCQSLASYYQLTNNDLNNNMICFDITMGCCQNPLMPVGYLCVSVASCRTVDSYMHVKIAGYWMGPDIEDGWGFVEAAVDRRI